LKNYEIDKIVDLIKNRFTRPQLRNRVNPNQLN